MRPLRHTRGLINLLLCRISVHFHLEMPSFINFIEFKRRGQHYHKLKIPRTLGGRSESTCNNNTSNNSRYKKSCWKWKMVLATFI
jgi:hypothetical protein